MYSPRQINFQIHQPDSTKFNQRVILDLMFLKDKKGISRPVLHVIDAGTRFSAAQFLKASDVDTVRNEFLRAWSSAYIGYPESMLTDQGSIFLSKEWRFSCDRVDISLQNTGTESHNSLGIREKYHSTLRTIYNKVAP